MNKLVNLYNYIDDPSFGFGVLSGFGLLFIARIATILLNEGLIAKFNFSDQFWPILVIIYSIGIVGCYYYLTDNRISKLKKFKSGFTTSTSILILGLIASYINE